MPPDTGQQLNLQTLISVVQNAVQAQNLIATNIANLTTVFNTAFPAPLKSSASWTPGGVANGASVIKTVPVTGAVLGSYVQASLGVDLQGCSLTGFVQSANTVEAVIINATGATVTFAATTLNVRVTAV